MPCATEFTMRYTTPRGVFEDKFLAKGEAMSEERLRPFEVVVLAHADGSTAYVTGTLRLLAKNAEQAKAQALIGLDVGQRPIPGGPLLADCEVEVLVRPFCG